MRANFAFVSRPATVRTIAAILAIVPAIGCGPTAPPESVETIAPETRDAESATAAEPTAPAEPEPAPAEPDPARSGKSADRDAVSAQPLAPVGNGAAAAAVPDVFAPTLDTLAQTEIPVLLPDRLPDAGSSLYASVRGEADRYAIDLGFVPDCRGNACMFGTIAARRGSGDYYELDEPFARTIELADGTEAYFNPMVCGASCAPPVLEWEYGGARYRMELKGMSEEAALGTLADLANSAIAAGDRLGRSSRRSRPTERTLE